MMRKIIIFDLIGTLAHFRKFYTNSSSLSYIFPPRTTISGMIAGILGFERDSYYEEFSVKNCRIALAIKSPVRKLVQTINYIRTKNINEVTGCGGHTQIPVEFLLPANNDMLRYRIYFYCKEEKLYMDLLERLKKEDFEYPIYLGITECIGQIIFCNESIGEKLDKKGDELFEFSSVIPVHKIKALPVLIEGYRYIKEDRVPVEFDSERRLTKVSGYILEQNCKRVKAIIKNEYIDDVVKITYSEFYGDIEKQITEHIIFMD